MCQLFDHTVGIMGYLKSYNYKNKNRMLSVAVAVLLVCLISVFPISVLAASSGSINFYVVSKVYVNNWGGKKSTLMKTYTYNSDGLVSHVNGNITGEFYTYLYNDMGNINQVRHGWKGSEDFVYSYIYNGNGFLTEIIGESAHGPDEGWTNSYFVTCNNKGWITRLDPYYKDNGNIKKEGECQSFTYNKKGLVVNFHSEYNGKVYSAKYYYNKKNDLIKSKNIQDTFNLKLKYNKHGFISARSGDGSYTFIYKKIRVNSRMLSRAKAQRWSIANWDLNHAFIYYMK